MATVLFYEKPGCGNNTKQKVWLAASGHTVLAKSLLTEKWSAVRLRPFFGTLPVAQWFNPSAPRVKSGEVDPAILDAQTALDMMIAEPLLIRRPLMEVNGVFSVGFDSEAVNAWIGLNDAKPNGDLESCPNGHAHSPHPCPDGTTSHSTDETTSHPTKQPKDGCQVVGYKPANGQVAGYLPQAGEGDKDSLRDDHAKPCPAPESAT